MTEKRKDFLLGLTTGTTMAFLVALVILSASYYSNVIKAGKTEGQVAGNKEVARQVEKNTAIKTDIKSDIKIAEGDYIRGRKDAPITIVEFSDFQCPYCVRFHETLKQVLAAYPDDVNLVFRHFPLDRIHPYSRQASEAAECAGEQGKFWEYSDGLFSNQGNINPSYFSTLAGNLGLNVSQFEECLAEDRYADKVEADYQTGAKNGVTGTPGWFINGRMEKGAVPYEQLKTMIDNLLK